MALLLSACTDDKQETGTETGTATETGTTTDQPTTTDTTGDPPGTSTVDPTDAGSDPTTTAPTTTDPSTGEAPPEVAPECVAACDKYVECGLSPPDEECAVGCSEQYQGETAQCAEAGLAFTGCLGGLTCQQIFAAIAQNDLGPCADAAAQLDEACGGFNECSTGMGGTSEDCDLEIDCFEEPPLKMVCNTETCTCLVDGEVTGSCAADAICEDIDSLFFKGQSCCGF